MALTGQVARRIGLGRQPPDGGEQHELGASEFQYARGSDDRALPAQYHVSQQEPRAVIPGRSLNVVNRLWSRWARFGART